LKTGRKTVNGEPSGDLLLQLIRMGSSDQNRPDWTLTIQGLGNSGLLESTEEFMFEAPTSGYVNQVRVSMQEGSPDYQNHSEKNFFVKLADGTFARIETRAYPKYNDEAAINIRLYLNPSGSRNLEYDPSKRIRTP
jgi:hypothetical protein